MSNMGAPQADGLSQAEPVARLGPSGFDPSRITSAVEAVEPSLLQPIIKRATEEFYDRLLATTEDYLRDNLDWNLKSHLSMLERENRTMRTQLHEIDRFICPPWCTHEQRIEWLSKADKDRAQLVALKGAVLMQDFKLAAAIAIEARRAATTGAVEDESADPKGIAQ